MGRRVTWRVAGRAASFEILLAMIIDGSICYLMSDDDANSDIGWHQWAGNICPVDFTIGRAESVLSWSAGWWFRSVRWWSNDFDGGSVMLTKIIGYYASKIIIWENHRGQTSQNVKRIGKTVVSAEIRWPRFPGSPPATMGFGPLSVAVSRSFFGLFHFFFLLYFSWHFSSFIGLIPLKKTCLEGMQIRAQSFLFFGKAEDFVADFPPRVETRPNNVGMT